MAEGYLNTPENSPGLFVGAQPDWQLKQKALDASNTFRGGLPTDANGNVDYMGAARALMQKGAFEPAKMMMELGLQQQGIAAASGAADRLSGMGGGAAAPAGSPPAPARRAEGSNLPTFASGAAPSDAAGLLAGFEGMRTQPYWDVNHYRIGYGSDTITHPDGSKEPVTAFSRITPQEAQLDLQRRIPEFQSTIVSQVGPEAWGKMPAPAQAALTSVAYNYGKLPQSVADAVSTGDVRAVAKAIADHASDNNGVNAKRRQTEAATILGGASPAASASASPAQVAGSPSDFDPMRKPQLSAGSVQMPGGGYAAGPAPVQVASNGPVAGIGGGQAAPTPAQAVNNAAPVTTPVQVAQNGDSDGPMGQHPYGPAATASQTQAQAENGGQQVAANVGVQAPQAPQSPQSPQGNGPIGLDPTLGGLLTGKWVGNPGGYVTALRAEAMRLSAYPSGKGAAEAYGKQADFIERELARNGIITPEMKNYQIAQQQGYRGSMMDYARDLEAQKAGAAASGKLGVEGSPQALQAAQQHAAAAAQGGAAGKLAVEGSPEAIRAKGQAVAAETQARQDAEVAAESQKAEQRGQGEYLGKLPGQLAAAADSAKLQSNLVDQMMNAGDQFRMGWGASAQQDFRKKLVALSDALGVDAGGAKEQTAGFEDFNKLAGQLTRQSIKDTGSSRAGIQEMQLVSGTLPSPDMTSEGFKTVAGQLKGLADFTLAKQQAGDAWLNAKGTMKGFESDWNKNATPAAFVLNRLQTDQPELFQRALSELSSTPAGRNVLAHVKASRAWGKSQGLF